MGIASGLDVSQLCVSSSVAEVNEFQAAFQTTFSQRWRGMSSRTVNLVPPVVRRSAKVDKRPFSVDESELVDGNMPICMSSLVVWLM